MFYRRLALTISAIGAALVAAPAAHAQAATVASAVVAPAGPTIDAARAGVRARVASRPTYDLTAENAALEDETSVSKSVALMIVGGAGIVTGALIGGGGGALVAVAGAGVGLYGLYLYLQ